MNQNRQRNAAIVGWGHTPFGRLSGQSIGDLIVSASREALASAGITGDDVDAVWLGHFNSGMVEDAFCSSMVLAADPGLRFKPAVRCENACASGAAAIYAAIDAIESGRVGTALVVGVEKMLEVPAINPKRRACLSRRSSRAMPGLMVIASAILVRRWRGSR
jgi:acetyl-CoA C-acetyltransferase